MHLRINTERCMGSGVCVDLAPEAFGSDDDGYAEVLIERPDGELVARVTEAARLCPTHAIVIDER